LSASPSLDCKRKSMICFYTSSEDEISNLPGPSSISYPPSSSRSPSLKFVSDWAGSFFWKFWGGIKLVLDTMIFLGTYTMGAGIFVFVIFTGYW